MTPYHADQWLTVYGGDCRDVLRELPAESVHCVITSPPFWGLRDYGTATWEGGEEGCDHKADVSKANASSRLEGGKATQLAAHIGAAAYRDNCGKCGARRIDRQLGLEATPDDYVATLVDVFREVRRVLRSDGTVWLNLGDSYAGGAGGRGDSGNVIDGKPTSMKHDGQRIQRDLSGLKPKDLVGIPWRVAFALQADGWYLRSDIIWSKPNPMPESVTDRPTKAHEYLFLLTKSGVSTFWTHRDHAGSRTAPAPDYRWLDHANDDAETAQEPPDWRTERTPDGHMRWRRINLWQGHDYFYDADAVREPSDYPELVGKPQKVSYHDASAMRNDGDRIAIRTAGRNLRSVWTIATAPYPGAHFATFPPKLVEPCVKAGTSERGVCPECGAPWARETSVEKVSTPRFATSYADAHGPDGRDALRSSLRVETTGWRPSCRHDAEPIPTVILDPFAGTGTVGMVAQRLSRRAILIDLNPDYLAQCLERNRDMPLGLVG